MELVLMLAVGFAAGINAGLFGVGGGLLFVPALVYFADLTQLEAEASSLVAIIPVAAVGAWRQRRYGNLRLRDGIAVGVLACPGAVAGVALANAISERTLEVAFGGLLVFVAFALARNAIQEENERP